MSISGSSHSESTDALDKAFFDSLDRITQGTMPPASFALLKEIIPQFRRSMLASEPTQAVLLTLIKKANMIQKILRQSPDHNVDAQNKIANFIQEANTALTQLYG